MQNLRREARREMGGVGEAYVNFTPMLDDDRELSSIDLGKT